MDMRTLFSLLALGTTLGCGGARGSSDGSDRSTDPIQADADADVDVDSVVEVDDSSDADDHAGVRGDLPCDGCAGDPCESNDGCLDGLTCNRINDTTAWCTNCTRLECESFCTADINCGEGGACLGGYCYHACADSADCPGGYFCYEGIACVPDDLPNLDQECAQSSSFFCELDPSEERTCLYYGADAVSDPGENFCTRFCDSDNDCLDTWALGCCVPLGDGRGVCTRREHCGGAAGSLCQDTCQWAGDGECDDGGPGSDYDACDFGTDCTDCGSR